MDEEILLNESDSAFFSMVIEDIRKHQAKLEDCKKRAQRHSAETQTLQQELVKIELEAQNHQGAIASLSDLVNKRQAQLIDTYDIPPDSEWTIDIENKKIIIKGCKDE